MHPTAMVDASAQHMRALEIANRVRLARSRLKRRVASGDLSVADVVASPPPEALTMEVGELLLSQRRWGDKRCHTFLKAIQISENKTIGSMTERQRGRLIEELDRQARAGNGRPAELEAPGLFPAWAA